MNNNDSLMEFIDLPQVLLLHLFNDKCDFFDPQEPRIKINQYYPPIRISEDTEIISIESLEKSDYN